MNVDSRSGRRLKPQSSSIRAFADLLDDVEQRKHVGSHEKEQYTARARDTMNVPVIRHVNERRKITPGRNAFKPQNNINAATPRIVNAGRKRESMPGAWPQDAMEIDESTKRSFDATSSLSPPSSPKKRRRIDDGTRNSSTDSINKSMTVFGREGICSQTVAYGQPKAKPKPSRISRQQGALPVINLTEGFDDINDESINRRRHLRNDVKAHHAPQKQLLRQTKAPQPPREQQPVPERALMMLNRRVLPFSSNTPRGKAMSNPDQGLSQINSNATSNKARLSLVPDPQSILFEQQSSKAKRSPKPPSMHSNRSSTSSARTESVTQKKLRHLQERKVRRSSDESCDELAIGPTITSRQLEVTTSLFISTMHQAQDCNYKLRWNDKDKCFETFDDNLRIASATIFAKDIEAFYVQSDVRRECYVLDHQQRYTWLKIEDSHEMSRLMQLLRDVNTKSSVQIVERPQMLQAWKRYQQGSESTKQHSSRSRADSLRKQSNNIRIQAQSSSPSSAEMQIRSANPSNETRRSSRQKKITYVGTPSPPRLVRWSKVNKLEPWSQAVEYPKDGPRRVTVDFKDLERLDEGEFLNDTLLSFALRDVEDAILQKSTHKIHFFNTYFYTALTSGKGSSFNYDAVKRWTKSIDLFSYDYIVVPINHDLHWFVAIVCNFSMLSNGSSSPMLMDSDVKATGHKLDELSISQEQPASIQDDLDPLESASSSRKRRNRRKVFRKFDPTQPTIITLDSFGTAHTTEVALLKDYLAAEALDKKQVEITRSDIQGVTAKNLVEQTNFCDCGLYLIKYVQAFAQRPKEFISSVLNRTITPEYFDNFQPSVLRASLRDLLLELNEEQEQERADRKRHKIAAKRAQVVQQSQQPQHEREQSTEDIRQAKQSDTQRQETIIDREQDQQQSSRQHIVEDREPQNQHSSRQSNGRDQELQDQQSSLSQAPDGDTILVEASQPKEDAHQTTTTDTRQKISPRKSPSSMEHSTAPVVRQPTLLQDIDMDQEPPRPYSVAN